jgi:hypothetical protein
MNRSKTIEQEGAGQQDIVKTTIELPRDLKLRLMAVLSLEDTSLKDWVITEAEKKVSGYSLQKTG